MDRRESLSALAEFTRDTGIRIALPPHATVLNVNLDKWANGTDTRLSITLDVYEVTESVRELRFVRHGKRMMIWTDQTTPVFHGEPVEAPIKTEYGTYFSYMGIDLWDDDFVPFTEHRVGKIETPAEYRARRDWEAMQYRVGTPRSPMDNAEVSACESDTTPAMYRHWNR